MAMAIEDQDANKGSWKPDEDDRLMEFIRRRQFQAENWVKISGAVGTRTAKQCRERYHQNLRPELDTSPMRDDEARLVLELVSTMGKCWAKISRRLVNRSDNFVKNWFNGRENRMRRAAERPQGRQSQHHGSHHQQQRQRRQAAVSPAVPVPAPSAAPVPPYQRASHPFAAGATGGLQYQRPLPCLDMSAFRRPVVAPQISPCSDAHPPSLTTDHSSPDDTHPSPQYSFVHSRLPMINEYTNSTYQQPRSPTVKERMDIGNLVN